ncbi:hypothetical protein WAK64_11495 [Bacillus spongiae]|uniref:Secreted protein n=1 Tax=Bacillus spongiae TaxID=2683610 RepID=A0ABU8HET0_9BACI
MNQLKKFIITIPILIISLFSLTMTEAHAGNGSTGVCSAYVNTDYTNYYQPGAKTVDVYASKPSSTCGGTVMYQITIEKYTGGKWVYHSRFFEGGGYFSFRSPTKSLDINKYFGSSGTYRVEFYLYEPNVPETEAMTYGQIYSHNIYIHY